MQPMLNIAVRAARSAGEIILRSADKASHLAVDSKGKNDFATEIDRLAEKEIISIIKAAYPEHSILAEESGEHAGNDFVWVIDPLDGTQEYSEYGRHDWAVHVALWERHDEAGQPSNEGSLTAGAVALPAVGLTLSTAIPPTTPVIREGKPRLVVSRSRATMDAIRVAEQLDCDVVRLGSAGAKAMAVVLGEVDIYVHSGGQHQWDSAAPVAVARAAGLHTSRVDGSPLVYNRRDTWLPDLVVCQQHLARPVLEALNGGRLKG